MKRRCRLCGDWFEVNANWQRTICGCEDDDDADLTTTRARPNPAPPPEPAQDKREEAGT